MHGIIMVELKKYITNKFDGETWNTLLKKAGLWPRLYVPVAEYPDEEVFSLVSTASEMTGLSPNGILEDFGEFVSEGLLKMYRPLVKNHWRTLDLIENTERSIHTAIRLKDKQAKPPQLQCRRLSEAEVVVSYNSPRKLCAVARGIAKGVAKHYGESIVISEASCMHRGDQTCEISIKSNEVRKPAPLPLVQPARPLRPRPEVAAEPPQRPIPVAAKAPPRQEPPPKRSWFARLFGLK